MSKPIIISLSTALVLFTSAGLAMAMGDQWYLGVGGGASQLTPIPTDSDIDIDSNVGQVSTLLVGRDFDARSSGQLQLFSLGQPESDTNERAQYSGAEAALLYRVYNSRENLRSRALFGASVYGRFGVGYLQRDSDIDLRVDSPVFFGAGAGLEMYFTRSVGVRLEGQYFDADAGAATLSVIGRFGGFHSGTARQPLATSQPDREPSSAGNASPTAEPLKQPTQPTLPFQSDAELSADASTTIIEPAPASEDALDTIAPITTASLENTSDWDIDGVSDANDQCPRSATGFPVGTDGCGLLGGYVQGLDFDRPGLNMAIVSTDDLNYIAKLLKQFPDSRIELAAHTDNSGTLADQGSRTRMRLKALGLYMLKQGVRANQLVLRSLGAERPLVSNASAEGRLANNRVEVFERPR